MTSHSSLDIDFFVYLHPNELDLAINLIYFKG